MQSKDKSQCSKRNSSYSILSFNPLYTQTPSINNKLIVPFNSFEGTLPSSFKPCEYSAINPADDLFVFTPSTSSYLGDDEDSKSQIMPKHPQTTPSSKSFLPRRLYFNDIE
jgi:hypothetical protein